MDKISFDNKLYLKIQKEKILERIKQFNGKLYLEFGGKLFDDYHASRVLRGFEADSKLQLLLSFKDECEIVIVINSFDIDNMKIRGDTGITYQSEVERLIDAYKNSGLFVSGVVFSFYHHSTQVDSFIKKLKNNKIPVYKHYQIDGYPNNADNCLSEFGFGMNDYIKTTRPLVVVTAPGPGSGKMAVCISQVYQDSLKGERSGYAKYETFPVWNLSLHHPIQLAYESATVDLNDVNMIDPYHFAHYGVMATNYNRDIESFSLLKIIFDKIYGKSPYFSPTDMGVNMVGFAITDEDRVLYDCKQEIIRRYYMCLKQNFLGRYDDELVEKQVALMSRINTSIEERRCVKACLEKKRTSGVDSCAIELNDGTIITGKKGNGITAASALILNVLKYLAGIDDKILIISKELIDSINSLKIDYMKNKYYHLHIDETLTCLAIQRSTDQISDLALKQADKLVGLQMHSSELLSELELKTLKQLGIDVTEEPVSSAKKLFYK